jgi:hypothetical protein
VSLAGATFLPAALAGDPIPFSDFDPYGTAERVVPSVLKVWPMWLMFAGASVAILLLCRRALAGGIFRRSIGQGLPTDRAVRFIGLFLRPPGPLGEWVGLTRILYILIAFFWTALFLHNSQYLGPFFGFDVKGYLDYIDHFQTAWSIPMPCEAWQTQHPPLYPFLAALILRTVGFATETANGILAIRLFNLVLALGNILAILACLRLIFPEHPRRWIIGLIVAGFLPMHIYLYQYPTNHILAGTLASVTVYFVLRILCVPDSGMRDYVCLGIALGLALLSIVTVGLLVPPVCLALAVKLYVDRDQLGPRCMALRVLVSAAAVFGVCGWYYILVWIHCGTPIVANMGVMSSESFSPIPWWQDPAFRTAGDYLRFGESLRAPLFSVWYSVWDGLYASLWGDSFCGGYATILGRPPWSYDHIVAGMSLALLPTVAILLAGGTAVLQFIRRPAIHWMFLLAVAFLVSMFLIYGATLLPCYSAVKSFYGLPAVVPLCALAALGLDLLSRYRPRLRGLVFVLLGIWAFNVAAAYWISPTAAETQRCLARQFIEQGDETGAIGRLEQIMAEYPDDLITRFILAGIYGQHNLDNRVRRVLELPHDRYDSNAYFNLLLGILAARENRPKEAFNAFKKAVDLAPDHLEAALAYASAVSVGGNPRAAIAAWRNVLRINPYFVNAHGSLMQIYSTVGDLRSARRHRAYATQIDEANQQITQSLPPDT